MTRGIATAALILAAVVCHPVVLTSQNAGVIAGIVVNEQQQPITRALMRVFAAGPSVRPESQPAVPFSGRDAGSTYTDAAGRFRIEGLAQGDYLVAAHAAASVLQRTTPGTAIYATTFRPSTIDSKRAVPVSATSSERPVRVQLVRVDGVRLSGSVVSPAGRPTTGMQVRLYRRFGGQGSQATAAIVNDAGAFEVSGVAPGWYRLTIGQAPAAPREAPTTWQPGCSEDQATWQPG